MTKLTEKVTLTVGILAVAPILFALAMLWTVLGVLRSLAEVWGK